jgi:hypothetical protein
MDLRGAFIYYPYYECEFATLVVGGMGSSQNVLADTRIWDDNCGSLNDYNISKDFFYPNPTFNTINLKDVEFNSKLSITSIDGSVVYQKQIKSEKEIDVSNLSQGIYFLQIEKNGKISTQKFIKQ